MDARLDFGCGIPLPARKHRRDQGKVVTRPLLIKLDVNQNHVFYFEPLLSVLTVKACVTML